ncbi:hypothetical protein [Rhizobium mongolense]
MLKKSVLTTRFPPVEVTSFPMDHRKSGFTSTNGPGGVLQIGKHSNSLRTSKILLRAAKAILQVGRQDHRLRRQLPGVAPTMTPRKWLLSERIDRARDLLRTSNTHSRLWNRNIIDQPKLPSEKEASFVKTFKGDERLISRPFLPFCIAQHLMKRINPTSTWQSRVRHLLEHEFSDLDHLGLDLSSMGVDKHWKRRWPKLKNP